MSARLWKARPAGHECRLAGEFPHNFPASSKLTGLTSAPRPYLVNQVDTPAMPQFISLYEAKTRLSALVERAVAGEEVVIAKNGVPRAKLVPIRFSGTPCKPANAIRVTYMDPDFDAPDQEIERLFEGDDPA